MVGAGGKAGGNGGSVGALPLSPQRRRLRGRNGGADFRRARAFVLRVKQRFEPNTQPAWGGERPQQPQKKEGEEGAEDDEPSKQLAGRRRGREEEDGAHAGGSGSVYRAFLAVLRDFMAEEAAVAARAQGQGPAEEEAAWAGLSRRVLERVLPLFEGHPDLVQGFCYFLPECLRVRGFGACVSGCLCLCAGASGLGNISLTGD